MTRSEIRAYILTLLDDPTSGYFDATTLNLWINLAQREVQKHLIQAGNNYYVTPVQSLTVLDQADYVLPTDFITLHRLEVIVTGTGVNENRQALGEITTNQQDLVQITSGIPTNYYIKKNRVTVSPTPDNAYVIRLYYSPRVADLAADNETPDVPEQFMEYVAILAAYNGFIKDDRAPENLVAKKQRYEELLTKMANDRTQDVSRQVVITQNWDSGMYW